MPYFSVSFQAERVERATVFLMAESREEAEVQALEKVSRAWGRYRNTKQTGVTDIRHTKTVRERGLEA